MLRVDALCAGIVVADHVCRPVSRMPGPGELVLTEGLELTVGGCAANVAINLATLGARVGVAGRVGQDIFGAYVRETLEEAGVDCQQLHVAQSGTSGTLVINVDGEDRRFVHAVGANAEFDAQHITREGLRQARVLYLGGFGLMPSLTAERVQHVFRDARDLGIPTVLDVVVPDERDLWPELMKLLPVTDVFVPNADEAARLLAAEGIGDPRDQAQRFRDAGAATAVVTCGEAGCVVASKTTVWSRPAATVRCVDGTGSGDAFAAGFLYGMLQGAAVERCVALGSALGAACVQHLGATTHGTTRRQLEQLAP